MSKYSLPMKQRKEYPKIRLTKTRNIRTASVTGDYESWRSGKGFAARLDRGGLPNLMGKVRNGGDTICVWRSSQAPFYYSPQDGRGSPSTHLPGKTSFSSEGGWNTSWGGCSLTGSCIPTWYGGPDCGPQSKSRADKKLARKRPGNGDPGCPKWSRKDGRHQVVRHCGRQDRQMFQM